MSAIADTPVCGTFRFFEPDLSVPAYERATFAGPAPKEAREDVIQLRNVRTATDIAQGAAGLDEQGFTYVEHTSSLTGDEIASGTNAEDIYARETIDLVLKLTGASRGAIHNICFRRKLATRQDDLRKVHRRGNEMDQALASLPRDRILVNGRDDDASEPARHAHCDMILKSLRDTLHLCRRDISAAGRRCHEAELLRERGAAVKVPRYAAYSVWRPLKTVKRDPIAVLDHRSVDASELAETDQRVPSEVTQDGDYIVWAWVHKPPKTPGTLKWYWMPEQKSNEVLVIKFCDSASADDKNVAAGCIHCSPIIPGTEHEEARCSVEARVYAFWD